MDTPWGRAYLRHFQHFFGKPFDVQTYYSDHAPPLRLAEYDRAYPSFKVYASLGLADQSDKVRELGEIILLADDSGKDVPFLFVNALFFVVQKGIPLGSPFAIGGVEMLKPEFAEYFDKAALYVTTADGFGEGFEEVQAENGFGTVYQALFISWAEQDFLNRQGSAAFEQKLRGQDTDLCSLRRPSCV